jgi:hypothetical protein
MLGISKYVEFRNEHMSLSVLCVKLLLKCLKDINDWVLIRSGQNWSKPDVNIELNYIYLLIYGAEPFLRSCQLCSHSRELYYYYYYYYYSGGTR